MFFKKKSKEEKPQKNHLVFRHKNLKQLKKLNELIIKNAPLFIDLASRRKKAIKNIFIHFKRFNSLDDAGGKELLNDLFVCVEDEEKLVKNLIKPFDESRLLFTKLEPLAKKTFSDCKYFSHDSLNFPKKVNICKLFKEKYHLIRNLFFLFDEYISHMKKRSLLEEKKLIAHKSSALLFKSSELRQLWHKDEELFDSFSKHLNTLNEAANELNKYDLVQATLFGSASFLMVISSNFFMTEQNVDGNAVLLFLLFFFSFIYNLALLFNSIKGNELDAEKILSNFRH